MWAGAVAGVAGAGDDSARPGTTKRRRCSVGTLPHAIFQRLSGVIQDVGNAPRHAQPVGLNRAVQRDPTIVCLLVIAQDLLGNPPPLLVDLQLLF